MKETIPSLIKEERSKAYQRTTLIWVVVIIVAFIVSMLLILNGRAGQ